MVVDKDTTSPEKLKAMITSLSSMVPSLGNTTPSSLLTSPKIYSQISSLLRKPNSNVGNNPLLSSSTRASPFLLLLHHRAHPPTSTPHELPPPSPSREPPPPSPISRELPSPSPTPHNPPPPSPTPNCPSLLPDGADLTKFSSDLPLSALSCGRQGVIDQLSYKSVIPLWKQLEYYKGYQKKLSVYLGESRAKETISKALHIISLGTNDFLENYYAIPGRASQYTPREYQNFLAGIAENFIHKLYGLGARKISLGGLPPMGCLPLERTTNFLGGNDCVPSYNNIALEFNAKLSKLTTRLNKDLPGIRLVFSNPYDVLLHIIKKPAQYGFQVTSMACCATGMFEMGYACSRASSFSCMDASKYVFWDSFHPTEKTNGIIAKYLLKNALAQFLH